MKRFDFPTHAEFAVDAAPVPRRRVILQVRIENAEAAFENLDRSGDPCAREAGGRDAALRGMAGVKEFRLRAVDPALQQPGREASSYPRCVCHLAGAQPHEAGGKPGSPESRGQPVG